MGKVALVDLQQTPLNPVKEDTTIQSEPAIPTLRARTLDDLLGDCIDVVLVGLLGTKAREAIYDYLERNYSLARQDLPKNVEKLFKLTEDVFGSGSKTIARCVIRCLYDKLGWKFEEIQGFEVSDYLEAARARIARKLVKNAKDLMLNNNTN